LFGCLVCSSMQEKENHPNTEHTNPSLEVSLKHKPRGSRGLWKTITEGERIRVDTRKGKLVQLMLRSNSTCLASLMCDITVRLVDLVPSKPQTDNAEIPQTFTVINAKKLFDEQSDNCIGSEALLKLKLSHLSKKQKFVVTIRSRPSLTPETFLATGSSPDFSSDDNGKVYCPKSSKREFSLLETANQSNIRPKFVKILPAVQ